MSWELRDRVGRLSIKRGWLLRIDTYAFFASDVESIAFDSLRGYDPAPGLTFDREDELAMLAARRSREQVLRWAKGCEAKHRRTKARAIAAIGELRSIYQATELELPLAPPEIESVQLKAMTDQIQAMVLNLYFPPYWDA